jgi:hypothetical protein
MALIVISYFRVFVIKDLFSFSFTLVGSNNTQHHPIQTETLYAYSGYFIKHNSERIPRDLSEQRGNPACRVTAGFFNCSGRVSSSSAPMVFYF